MSAADEHERLVVVTRADDGSTSYEMHTPAGVCRFTIERRGRWGWGCNGINWPIDEYEAERSAFLTAGEASMVSTCRDDGWITTGWHAQRRCLRKVLRTARERNRERIRDRQLKVRGAPGYTERLERDVLGPDYGRKGTIVLPVSATPTLDVANLAPSGPPAPTDPPAPA